jgi:hypothetical protein
VEWIGWCWDSAAGASFVKWATDQGLLAAQLGPSFSLERGNGAKNVALTAHFYELAMDGMWGSEGGVRARVVSRHKDRLSWTVVDAKVVRVHSHRRCHPFGFRGG